MTNKIVFILLSIWVIYTGNSSCIDLGTNIYVSGEKFFNNNNLNINGSRSIKFTIYKTTFIYNSSKNQVCRYNQRDRTKCARSFKIIGKKGEIIGKIFINEDNQLTINSSKTTSKITLKKISMNDQILVGHFFATKNGSETGELIYKIDKRTPVFKHGREKQYNIFLDSGDIISKRGGCTKKPRVLQTQVDEMSQEIFKRSLEQ